MSRRSGSVGAPGERSPGRPGPISAPGDPFDPIESLRGGDRQALATLFEQHRQRLRRIRKS
jgi:hypothetical protein